MSTNKGMPNLHNSSISQVKVLELEDAIVRYGGSVPEGFNPDEIHWITTSRGYVGITDFEGSSTARDLGYVVINTAGELQLDSPAHFHFDVHPSSKEDMVAELNKIAKCIDNNIDEGVVVHCSMGMERSPISVVWYMHTYQGFTIDQAYDIVRQARPITMDHREWLDD